MTPRIISWSVPVATAVSGTRLSQAKRHGIAASKASVRNLVVILASLEVFEVSIMHPTKRNGPMNTLIKMSGTAVLMLSCLIASAPMAVADDTDDLTALLHEFLARVSERETHDRFWASELIYTSSSGTRTTKAEIMSGFDESDGDEDDEAAPAYSAEDIHIQTYGATAVVAFRLVATSAGGADQEYFNTGTFLKRDGEWQVVAWQATSIPQN
jgi:hypothetical protein